MTRKASGRKTLASRRATVAALAIAFLLGPSGVFSTFHIDAALAKNSGEGGNSGKGVGGGSSGGEGKGGGKGSGQGGANGSQGNSGKGGGEGKASGSGGEGKGGGKSSGQGAGGGKGSGQGSGERGERQQRRIRRAVAAAGKGGRAEGAGEARGAGQGGSLGAPTASSGSGQTVNAATQDRVRLDGPNVQVLHRNGMTETVSGGRYEMKDAPRPHHHQPAGDQPRQSQAVRDEMRRLALSLGKVITASSAGVSDPVRSIRQAPLENRLALPEVASGLQAPQVACGHRNHDPRRSAPVCKPQLLFPVQRRASCAAQSTAALGAKDGLYRENRAPLC